MAFLDKMQDMDSYLQIYNRERIHQGKNMNGKTPYQAFIDGLRKTSQARRKPAAAWPLSSLKGRLSGEYYLCTLYPM
jgi:hypothetical protein